MLSMRAKSLPLLASMAAIALTAPSAFADGVTVAANAASGTAQSYPGSPECAKYGTTMMGAACEIVQDKKEIKENRAETARLKKIGEEADARGAAADAIGNCVKYLTAGVKSGAFNKAEIVQKAGGKLNDVNACPIAKDYGFGKKAEVSPGLN